MCGLCDASNRHVGRYPDLHNTDAHALLRDAIEDLCGVVIETSFGYLRSAIIKEVQPLQTARLSLRVPELADAEPLMDIFWDPEVVAKKQVTLTEPPGDLELARRQTAGMIHHW